MKTIKFNNKSYQIPTCWEEVTLEMQIKVSDIAAGEKYVQTLGIIAGYTGIDVQELKNSPINNLVDVMKQLKFIDKPIPAEPIFKFEFKGSEYIINPDILNQEFQDFVAIQTAIAEHADSQWKLTPYILAVMAKKAGETLDDFDVNTRAKEFLQLDVTIANRVSAFFLNNTKILNLLMMYSSPVAREEILQSKIGELNSSLNKLQKQRGGNLLIRLWIMTSRKYIKFLRKEWERYFNSPASDNSKKKWNTTYTKFLWKNRKPKVNK